MLNGLVMLLVDFLGSYYTISIVNDMIIVGQRVLCLLSVYAPQCGLSDSVKDLFYDQLRAVTAMIPA